MIELEASYQPSPPDERVQPDISVSKEQDPQTQELVTNYHAIAQAEAERRAPEFAGLITEIVTEIDRQGIDSFTTYETEKGKWPVNTVSVTEIFRKIFADKIPSIEAQVDLEKEPQKRVTLIIPGFSPPPVGHPFTPWDYVYNQVFTDLRRLFAAHKKGEPLPDIQVQVLGSANSDWGEVTPEFLGDVQEKGFGAHGEVAAGYLKENLLQDSDYVRVNGISMGSLIATEAIDHLSDEELEKMQFVLDNPADQYYKSRLFKMLRAVQLPLGMGLDYAQVLARLPHYGEVYKGEPSFLSRINKFLARRKNTQEKSESIPQHVLLNMALEDETIGDEEKLKIKEKLDIDAQMTLKKQAFKAECLLLLKQPTADLDKRVFVRKGVTDLTTSTFGDVMFSLLNKLGRRRLFRQMGRRKHFTVNSGHQRENFAIEKWVKILQRGTKQAEEMTDLTIS